jgi:hypothetical protein
MKPERAIRRFLSRVSRDTFGDYFDLFEPLGERRKRWTAVERTMREHLDTPKVSLAKLHDQILLAVPEEHRRDLFKALDALSSATVREFAVREQIAYRVGVEVGRLLGK